MTKAELMQAFAQELDELKDAAHAVSVAFDAVLLNDLDLAESTIRQAEQHTLHESIALRLLDAIAAHQRAQT